ncbi:Microspherule protein 1 isoform X3 [Oopsacas minuta]|uniref:Microspherule protein 1 isoform X3 n=1 Tax=Oopsacas minuta TaxID=111878 RepID=A0AAV7JWL7_9METZ|nr:Microspherule protein 1 isoform X3 [Oopsacas minuta]
MNSQKPLDTNAASKRRQTSKHSMIEINKTRWTPLDDVMLVQGVQQTSSLLSVFLGTKFSCKFTMKEIEERWDALLYNSALSTTAMEDIALLCYDERSFSEAAVLWSPEEERTLTLISSKLEPNVQEFEAILANNLTTFHPSRTPHSLHYHWSLLKKYNLLCDQSPSQIHSIPNQFSQALLGLKDKDLTQEQGHREMACLYEKRLQDKKQKVEVITLEKQLADWRFLLEGSLCENFTSDTFACLKGKNSHFIITSPKVTIGRNTDEDIVDIDLSKEGPALKISRKQAFIQFDSSSNKFYITNIGRCHIFINDTPLMTENSQVVEDMCLIAFGELSFIFVINPCLPNQMSNDS